MKVIDIAIKDLKRSGRSLFLLGMTVAAPLLITLLLYFAFGNLKSGDVSMTPIHVGVVNLDQLPDDSVLTTPIGENIRSIFFDDSVKSWITASDYVDELSARADLNAQKIGVAVIIPASLSAEYLRGGIKTPVLILQDPTLSIGPLVVRDIIVSMLDGVSGGGVMYQVLNSRAAANGKPLESDSLLPLFDRYAAWYTDFQRALFHDPQKAALVQVSPSVGSAVADPIQAMIGPMMAGQLIFFAFFTSAYAMLSILQESEEGTLARLFTTPTSRTAILAGKFLAVFITVLFQSVILLAAGTLFFGIRWGEAGSIILALFGQVVAAGGLGVLLVSFVKTNRQGGPVLGAGLSALGMLSGLFTANIDMPESFNALANFTPQGWVLKAWKLSIIGQPASELVTPFVVLAIMGLIMFIVGAMMFRKRFA